ncbi:MAG: BREX-2 system adenine-specific DNA-methyltransferase PglX, partial [Myxococcales bacterium]|nr:BREX-2 system adenine-specific DNA-methyltransferase PglX [Myxococcales bacterium]
MSCALPANSGIFDGSGSDAMPGGFEGSGSAAMAGEKGASVSAATRATVRRTASAQVRPLPLAKLASRGGITGPALRQRRAYRKACPVRPGPPRSATPASPTSARVRFGLQRLLMTPTTYASLLKDLQRLEKRVTEAHVALSRSSPRLAGRLGARHTVSETGGRVEDFVVLCARKSAVQFLLRTVYVRVLEDLGALDPPRIRGDRGFATFKDVAPGLGVRAYLKFVFADLSRDFPGLFTAGPDEVGELPPEDLCREVWDLWHHPNRDGVTYDWAAPEAAAASETAAEWRFDSRFLGDLYQDLDAEVRKRYALLQTPDFVERYILDHTLTPALAEFGLEPESVARQGGGVERQTIRVLDPTCGSGHFLIGAFRRLAAAFEATGLSARAACERALDGVWGCDLNPHAVDIARFRLLLEVIARTGDTDAAWLGDLSERLHLTVMDSLVPWEKGGASGEQADLFDQSGAKDRLSKYATAEERAANAAFLSAEGAGGFHVVVGNPPYITPKDVRKRDDYRAFWPDSAAGKYAMSAPFVERFFSLGVPGAYVGQITANSFMKREFGKRLVERALPRVELTRVVDTSGAYIPGHGTPTVILFGQNRTSPRSGTIWAVLGKRGEPKRPAVAAQGLVWSAIA